MLETFLTAIAHRMPRPHEPTIAEMLSDSIVQALMQADGVDPEALATLLNRLRASVDPAETRQLSDQIERIIFYRQLAHGIQA